MWASMSARHEGSEEDETVLLTEFDFEVVGEREVGRDEGTAGSFPRRDVIVVVHAVVEVGNVVGDQSGNLHDQRVDLLHPAEVGWLEGDREAVGVMGRDDVEAHNVLPILDELELRVMNLERLVRLVSVVTDLQSQFHFVLS